MTTNNFNFWNKFNQCHSHCYISSIFLKSTNIYFTKDISLTFNSKKKNICYHSAFYAKQISVDKSILVHVYYNRYHWLYYSLCTVNSLPSTHDATSREARRMNATAFMLSDVSSILSPFIYIGVQWLLEALFLTLKIVVQNRWKHSYSWCHPIWNKVLTNEFGTKHCWLIFISIV